MSKRRVKQKNVTRCACCNKITNGHSVVRTDHAVDFVKKQGYSVYQVAFPWERDLPPIPSKMPKMLLLGLIITLLLPLATAGAFDFYVDFTLDHNLYLLIASFVLAGILFYFRFFAWTSIILFANGMVMFMSEINWVFALPPIILSILFSQMGGKT